MNSMELEAKARELKEWQRLAEEAAETITALQDELKAVMTAQGADELKAGAYKITWKQITSARLDTATLKKELPELAERYTKTTTTRRFVVV